MATDSESTALDIDAIEARVNAATEGPWGVVLGDTVVSQPSNVTRGSASYKQCIARLDDLDYDDDEVSDDDDPPSLTADAEFIAATRTDVPALLAEVRRLRALVGPA